MTIQQEVDALRSVPLFARLEPSKLKLLAFTSERVQYREGQVLFKQGDPGDAAYIVLEGEVEVLIDTPQGQVAVARLGPNNIVGEIAILIDVPRTATVQALTRLVTLRISKDLFFRLVTEFPQISVEIMRVLAHRVEDTNSQLREAVGRAKA